MWPIKRILGPVFLAAGALAAAAACAPARAQNAYCNDLKAEIANAGRNSGAARYRAAAAKQQSELSRTGAYARSLGCDRGQFLFFGDPPPPQCGQINARIAHMRANLGSLQQQGGGGDGSRQSLLARYDAQCRDRPAVAARALRPQPRNFFEELFGVSPPDEGGGLRQVPVEEPRGSFPAPNYLDKPDGGPDDDERPRGGSMAICVRACDGGFFPVSYSARRSSLDALNDLCKALCPNADVTLYTRSPWRDLDSAVSIDGAAYSDHPNALKFQKSYDAACGCKRPGESWVETLADAERILAAGNSRDVVVTAEQAEQLSRPIAPGEGRGKKKNMSTRQDAPAPPQPVAEPATGSIADGKSGDGDKSAQGASIFREITGPDGIKRRVRVVAPTL